MRRLALITLVLTFAALIAPLARAAEAGEHPRTVSTTGEATVYVQPDEVVLNVGIETYNASLEKAKAQNDEAAARLVKAIRAMGVEEKHLQAAQLEVELRYRRHDQPIQEIEGYIARRAYAVTLKKVSDFQKLVDVCLGNGANRLMGFEYRTSELRKHRDAARKMAIKAAKEKAVALSAELDCKVGAPRSINEGAVGYWGSWPRSWGNAYMSQNQVQFAQAGDGASGGEAMPLGQIAIRASVSVVFDLLPEKATAQ